MAAGDARGAGREAGAAFRAIGDALKPSPSGRGPENIAEDNIPVVSWAEFLRRFTWKQGEHVTAIGTTGSGKTTTLKELMRRRTYVVAFATKAKDETMMELIREQKFTRVSAWPPAANTKRVVLWPDMREGEAREIKARVRRIFGEALSSIYRQGGWCAFLDELRFIVDYLKLGEEYELLMQQGRSLGISVVGATQRPRFIPLVAYDQATHLFFWRENDAENLDRVGGIGWTDSKTLKRTIANLEFTPGKGGQFLYLNTRTGEMLISKAEV